MQDESSTEVPVYTATATPPSAAEIKSTGRLQVVAAVLLALLAAAGFWSASSTLIDLIVLGVIALLLVPFGISLLALGRARHNRRLYLETVQRLLMVLENLRESRSPFATVADVEDVLAGHRPRRSRYSREVVIFTEEADDKKDDPSLDDLDIETIFRHQLESLEVLACKYRELLVSSDDFDTAERVNRAIEDVRNLGRKK
ncbi:hypothetical protein ACQPX6_00340 [Actinomycetospora sp. CA-101289]|uniref:hypothetical protein n=1 Tax=Actinomycetospora sp. CA-101289 TaxID=3239893 RepID=UPI003D96F561